MLRDICGCAGAASATINGFNNRIAAQEKECILTVSAVLQLGEGDKKGISRSRTAGGSF